MRSTAEVISDIFESAMADDSGCVKSNRIVHTAASNAEVITELVDDKEALSLAWRFIVLQTIDTYRSAKQRGGLELAQRVFTEEPKPTGYPAIDTALAALAEWLANQDGWQVPAWAADPKRTVLGWFPLVLEFERARALSDSPQEFKKRGIFVTPEGLARA